MKIFFAVFFGILAAVAVIGLVVFVFVGYRGALAQREEMKKFDQEFATSNLRTINIACITYASTYEHGFPEQLRDLVPPASGDPDIHHAGLIDEALGSGKSRGYFYIYTVTKRDGRRIEGYTVVATRKDSTTEGSQSFFMDESGVIRSTKENRPATANDPPVI